MKLVKLPLCAGYSATMTIARPTCHIRQPTWGQPGTFSYIHQWPEIQYWTWHCFHLFVSFYCYWSICSTLNRFVLKHPITDSNPFILFMVIHQQWAPKCWELTKVSSRVSVLLIFSQKWMSSRSCSTATFPFISRTPIRLLLGSPNHAFSYSSAHLRTAGLLSYQTGRHRDNFVSNYHAYQFQS